MPSQRLFGAPHQDMPPPAGTFRHGACGADPRPPQPGCERAAFARSAPQKREANAGITAPGSAHPDLCRLRRRCFDRLIPRPTRSTAASEDVQSARLSSSKSHDGPRTEAACARTSVSACSISSVAARPRRGAADNLMEDAATSEISRSQICQELHFGVDAQRRPARATRDLFERCLKEEMERVRANRRRLLRRRPLSRVIGLFRNLSTATARRGS